MPTRIDQLFYTLDMQRQGFDRAVADVQRQLKKMGVHSGAAASSLGRMEKQMGRLGRMAAGLKGALGGLIGTLGGFFVLRAITRTMSAFETTLAEIETIAPGGREQVEQLREAILRLMHDVPQSADELGAGAYQILSSGITDTADVVTLLTAASKAAVGGLTDTATAVDLLTTVLNAYHLSADDAVRVSDVLFETVRLGKLRFDTIATSIGTAVTSAALAGVRIEELSAAMATMTLVGIDVNEATSSLNRLFLTLVNQTDAQRRKFAELGISFSTATVAQKGFAGLLEEVNRLTEGQLDTLAELFPNIRAARSAFVLAGNSLDQYRAILEQLDGASGSAESAFERMNRTVQNQYKHFKNELNIVLQEAGVTIVPILSKALEGTAAVIRTITLMAKLMGIQFAVVMAKAELLAAVVKNAFVQALAGVTTGLRDLLQNISIGLAAVGGFPGGGAAELVAMGAEKAAQALDRAATAQESWTENTRRGVQAAADNLRFTQEAALAASEQAVAEAGFARTREERREATEALARAERELQQQAQRAAREEQERENLRAELARRVASITQTAAEQELAAIETLRRRYIEAYGAIGDEAEAQFRMIEEAAERALRLERAEELADSMRQAMTAALQQIELETSSITDAAEREAEVRRQQIDLYETMRDHATDLLDTAGLTAEEQEAIRKLLAEIVKLLNQAQDAQEGLADAAERERKAAEERFRNLQTTVSLIRQAADGALDLADAFGLVSEETKDTLDNLAQIATSAITLGGAIGAGNVPGMISGGLGVLGGLAGFFGESPEVAAQREAIAHNTQALEKLKGSLDKFRGTFDVAGGTFAQLQDAIMGPLAVMEQLGEEISVGDWESFQAAFDQLRRNLLDAGLTFADVTDLARELGIEIDLQAGTQEQVRMALRQLSDRLEQVGAILTGFPKTVEGMLARLQTEFDLFDIEDPIEQLERFQDALARLAEQTVEVAVPGGGTITLPRGQGIPALQAFAGLDLSTAEGRRRAEQLIQELFQQFVTGALKPEDLGLATPEEFLDLLREMENLLDQIEGGQAGQTQEVSRQVQITELQASEWLALGRTQTILQGRIEEHLRTILAVMSGQTAALVAPPAPAQAGVAVSGPQQTVVNVGPIDVTITGATADAGQAAGDAFIDRISRELGRKLADRRRLLGLDR